jgi:hypothetical protein
MVFLVVFLFLSGHPDLLLERSPQPDLATCLQKAREAMKYANDFADHITYYDEDGLPLPRYNASAVCKESE